MLATILACVISAVAAIGVYILVTNVIFKKSLKKKREAILKEAEAEGEVIKKEKILQAKEKFIQLKSDHDRAVNERNQKLNQREQGIKQQESSLGQQQLAVQVAGNPGFKPGHKLRLTFSSDALHYFDAKAGARMEWA